MKGNVFADVGVVTAAAKFHSDGWRKSGVERRDRCA